MERRLDPDIGRILPVLALKDAANLTPKRARDELVALTDRRKDVPLPQPAAVVDVTVDGAAGSIPARMYCASTAATATVVFFHGGGWVAGDLYTHDRHLRALSLALDAVVLRRRLPSSTRGAISCGFRRCPRRDPVGSEEHCTAWRRCEPSGSGRR